MRHFASFAFIHLMVQAIQTRQFRAPGASLSDKCLIFITNSHPISVNR